MQIILVHIQKNSDITHLNINFEISKKRSGDPTILMAKNEKAKKILNWQPKYILYTIINSALN